VEKKYIKSVNGLILNSNSTLLHLQNLVGPDVPAHVIAVPAGDNFSNINNNNPVTPGIRTNPDTLKVLYVGNVISQKGVDKIIKSMSGPEMVDIQLTITGRTDIEPGYARRINRLIKKYHMLDRVHLTGPMNTDLLKHAYQSHDVLVLPSVNEAYGIVYLEAMSFGLPVIGTTAGGAKEIIKHGENGLLIPPGDYFQLMQYLSRLHLDRDLLNRLGKNALMTYQLHPTWNDTCRIIREFLCQMVSQAKHSK
jgi:glycosyltransferase involved in cell wall biosynthesis